MKIHKLTKGMPLQVYDFEEKTWIDAVIDEIDQQAGTVVIRCTNDLFYDELIENLSDESEYRF